MTFGQTEELALDPLLSETMESGSALTHIARLAARCAEVPLACVVIVDDGERDQTAFGMELQEVEGILAELEPLLAESERELVIADTVEERRLRAVPCRKGRALRFVAAVPLCSTLAEAEGAIWLFDFRPRPGLEDELLRDLKALMALLRDEIAMRRGNRRLQKIHRDMVATWQVIPDVLYFAEPDRRISAVNEGFVEHFGYTPAEALGRTTRFLYSRPEDYESTARRYNPQAPDRTEPYYQEYRRKDGTTFLSQTIGVHVRNEQGQTLGYLGVIKDVTEEMRLDKERVRALERLRQSEELLQETNRLALVGGGRYDLQSGLVHWSEELYRIHDLPVGKELTVAETAQFFDRPDADALQSNIERAIETGEPFDMVAFITTAKGRRRWVRIKGQAVKENGEVVAIQGFHQDITEQKQAEDAKREFVSVVSHELRTPLTAIRGTLGLVAAGVVGELPTEAMELLDVALKSSEHLGALIDDILDIEKIEAGKLTLVLGPVDVVAVVKEVVERHHSFAAEFAVTLELSHAAAEAWIRADEKRLQQVLTNLLSNAVKYSPIGANVEVTVEPGYDAVKSEEVVRIAICDHGKGIPEEFHARLFDKFTRADTSDTRQRNGTGLGLSIAKALAEEMGGRIGFDTAADLGTTMYVEFPSRPPETLGVAS